LKTKGLNSIFQYREPKEFGSGWKLTGLSDLGLLTRQQEAAPEGPDTSLQFPQDYLRGIVQDEYWVVKRDFGCNGAGMKNRKKKIIDVGKEARRVARKSGVAPAATRVIPDKRKLPLKHKKQGIEKELD
jgi:hypothetical protein